MDRRDCQVSQQYSFFPSSTRIEILARHTDTKLKITFLGTLVIRCDHGITFWPMKREKKQSILIQNYALNKEKNMLFLLFACCQFVGVWIRQLQQPSQSMRQKLYEQAVEAWTIQCLGKSCFHLYCVRTAQYLHLV